jgi:hypothetical protein
MSAKYRVEPNQKDHGETFCIIDNKSGNVVAIAYEENEARELAGIHEPTQKEVDALLKNTKRLTKADRIEGWKKRLTGGVLVIDDGNKIYTVLKADDKNVYFYPPRRQSWKEIEELFRNDKLNLVGVLQ